MDIKQEIEHAKQKVKDTQRELDANNQKAREMQEQSKALMEQSQIVLHESFRLEGELRGAQENLERLKKENGAKPKGEKQ